MEQLNVGGQWCSSWVFLAVARDPNGAELSPLRNVSAVPALSRSKKPGRDCWAARRLFWLTKTSPPNVVKSQDKSGFRSFRLESKIFESFLPQLLFWLAAHPHTDVILSDTFGILMDIVGKKCFCLREPVFWGRIFLILRRNFPNMDEDFPNIEEKFS